MFSLSTENLLFKTFCVSDDLLVTQLCPWRRQWHPTPVLLPGKSHGQRSLVGCSPWVRWESDTTEQLHFHFHALEKEMATRSSVLAWRIPGMGKPGGLPPMGLHRVGHDWSNLAAAAAVVVSYSLWPQGQIHGILQARILAWVSIPFSRESSQPRDRSWVSCIVARFFTVWATKEGPLDDISPF